jgi:hypothetical protein
VPDGANVEGVAILEFASVEAAKAWYNSAANQIRCRIALWPTKQRHEHVRLRGGIPQNVGPQFVRTTKLDF